MVRHFPPETGQGLFASKGNMIDRSVGRVLGWKSDHSYYMAARNYACNARKPHRVRGESNG